MAGLFDYGNEQMQKAQQAKRAQMQQREQQAMQPRQQQAAAPQIQQAANPFEPGSMDYILRQKQLERAARQAALELENQRIAEMESAASQPKVEQGFFNSLFGS